MMDSALIADVNQTVLESLSDSLASIGGGAPFEVAVRADYSPFAEVLAEGVVISGLTSDLGGLSRGDVIDISGRGWVVSDSKSDGLGWTEVNAT